MDKRPRARAIQKVFYRPIEAAIRWSGLIRAEPEILEQLGRRKMPNPDEMPRWPMLRFNAERLYDGIAHGDLPFGRDGLTTSDPTLLDDSDLTIRHVDLKRWMLRFYPDEKPAFLFGRAERQLPSFLSFRALRVLLADREFLKIELAAQLRTSKALGAEVQTLRAEREGYRRLERQDLAIGSRSESTYLNIIGGLLFLLLGSSPNGTSYSRFKTQESVISALMAHFEGRLGISERTLESKFAAAKRQLSER